MVTEAKLKMVDLFSGIGGFSLAAHWTNLIETILFVEIDKFCTEVLKKNFKGVPIFNDIKDIYVDSSANLLYINEKGEVITMAQNKSSKYDNAISLYSSGLSIEDCADYYGISRQAMHKILQRRDCKFRSNIKIGKDNTFFRNSELSKKKKRVQHITEKAIKKGILKVPVKCSKCYNTQEFKDGRNGIQAHHNDYNKPLEVIWLCQKCHHKWHKINKPLNEKDEKDRESAATVDIVCGGFP